MKIEEIYHAIGQSIVDSIEDDWDHAILNIKYTGKSGGFDLSYFIKEQEKNSDYSAGGYNIYKAVKELHQITTEGGHNKWNRIEFKLTADGDMDLEFIWDQELFDELERLSKE
ncbi:hypothetical protein ABGT15_06580 [Flavobacterium enshiense]|uniref:hypothetical protein n=1 Tax=Flavobacterium enshiense TaxID=1341165 RepID=UPI00345CBD20